MKTTLTCALSFSALLAFGMSGEAWAQGSLKINSTLLDTESANAWAFSPSAEFAFSTPVKAAWAASTQLRLPAIQLNETQASLALRVKEALVSLELVEGTVSAGRILVRPESTSLNEIAKGFMRSEPVVDGFRLSSLKGNTSWSIFAGGPWVLGFSLGKSIEKTKFSLLYRGERDKISMYPVLSSDGLIVNSPRAAHTQEAELSVKVSGEKFNIEGLFQLMNQGLQRKITKVDEVWGEQTVGSVDSVLPRSYNEYRVGAQGKMILDESAEGQDWLVLSWASRTAPRFHDGTEEQKFFRQGGGNDSQFAAAIESSNPIFSAQVGTSLEYSPSPKYLYFAKRSDSGDRELIKAKANLWMSTRIKF